MMYVHRFLTRTRVRALLREYRIVALMPKGWLKDMEHLILGANDE